MSGTSDMFELGLLKYNGATTIPDSGTCEGNVPLSVTSDADIATPRGVVEPDKPGKLVSCTAKKVKTSSSEVAGKRARRSTRLATKKVRLEELQVRRKLKGLKGARRLYEEEESEGEEEERDNDLTEEEMGRVGEAAAGFVSSTEKQDQYVRFPLPRVVCVCVCVWCVCVCVCVYAKYYICYGSFNFYGSTPVEAILLSEA